MARVVTIPAEGDLLCEGCGYVLNGLPAGANCPECGKPADESSPSLRGPAVWENSGQRSTLAAFLRTSADVLFRPTRFFRTLTPRPKGSAALRFAQIHWAVAAVLLGTTAVVHTNWFVGLARVGTQRLDTPPHLLAFLICASVATYVLLVLTTRLAAWLTTWEAGYRGLRLPMPVVLRGLYFHAAHYLPVSLVACATVVGYQLALSRGLAGYASATTYLYVLCGEVVVGAGYLFSTYWTAMRNLIYANRDIAPAHEKAGAGG